LTVVIGIESREAGIGRLESGHFLAVDRTVVIPVETGENPARFGSSLCTFGTFGRLGRGGGYDKREGGEGEEAEDHIRIEVQRGTAHGA
jgi:hypothetical protein